MPRSPSPSCSLFGVLARDVPAAVLLRRGPTRWVELIRWDTATDTFERGQWFHGQIYKHRCDLSTDGKLFVYFAGKQTARQARSDYTYSWTAVSKPPWFTALGLWPKGDCWDGGGYFESPRFLHLNHAGNATAHPDHPVPDSFRVSTNRFGRGEDIPIYSDILLSKGWRRLVEEAGGQPLRAIRMLSTAPGSSARLWEKPSTDGKLALRMELEDYDVRRPGGPMHFGFSLVRAADGELLHVLDAQWADWDQSGRLVYSRGGKLFGAVADEHRVEPVELADFTADKPVRIITPPSASEW